MKTITLQVCDINEAPPSTGWYYVLAANGNNLLAIDWLRFDGQNWCNRYNTKIDVVADGYVYWFDLGSIMEINS